MKTLTKSLPLRFTQRSQHKKVLTSRGPQDANFTPAKAPSSHYHSRVLPLRAFVLNKTAGVHGADNVQPPVTQLPQKLEGS